MNNDRSPKPSRHRSAGTDPVARAASEAVVAESAVAGDLPPQELDLAAGAEEDDARLPEAVDDSSEPAAEGPLAVGRAAIARRPRPFPRAGPDSDRECQRCLRLPGKVPRGPKGRGHDKMPPRPAKPSADREPDSGRERCETETAEIESTETCRLGLARSWGIFLSVVFLSSLVLRT